MPSSLQLKKIQKYRLGLRSGTDAAKAAYCMSDMGDELNGVGESNVHKAAMNRMNFIREPVRGGEWERLWCAHYYNSVDAIWTLAPSHRGTLLLVDNANFTNGSERYLVQNGKGDGKTFRKCHALVASTILGRWDFDANTTVTTLLGLVTAALDAQPDPGNAFM
jgi:hypothetical protein